MYNNPLYKFVYIRAMHVNRYFISACISLGILVLLLLLVGAIHFSSHISEDEYFMEMMLDDEYLMPEKQETKPKNEPPKPVTHKAYNSKIKSEFKAEENFQSLDEFYKQAEAELEASREARKKAIREKLGLSEKQSQGNSQTKSKPQTAPKEIAINTNAGDNVISTDREATITYSLTNRILADEIPNPVYTCETGGKVVINIKVNADGRVVHAKFNKSGSTTTNGCLIDNAIAYAEKTLFNTTDDTKMQLGTITYHFQDK